MTDPVVTWLTNDADPAVRFLARRELAEASGLADGHTDDPERSPVVLGLLDGVRSSQVLRRPYAKWWGAHWRLVSLVEVGAGPEMSRADDLLAACDVVLDLWASPKRLRSVPVVLGRARPHASQEGNAVAVACRLGLASDPRVRRLVESLLSWQWPDGGWNCDIRPDTQHSSFHETLPALWGLHEYRTATGDAAAAASLGAAAELLLDHEVIFSRRTGLLADRSFAVPHYPPYWHYDLLQALLVLHRAGFGGDPRTQRARDLLASRRRRDGTWQAARTWWRPPGASRTPEAVDWGSVADQMVTLNAYRVHAETRTPSTVGPSNREKISGAGH